MAVSAEKQLTPGIDTVDALQVEAALQNKQLGERIRRLRSRRGMGLVELGQKTGLSASFLSQLETGRVVPTVRNLARIGMAFNKDLSWFFRQDLPSSFRLLRREERVRIHRNSDAAPSFLSESMHSLIHDEQLVPCIAEFQVAESDAIFKPRVFPGIEFTYILDGGLMLWSDGQTELLQAGDIAWVDSRRKRHYCCPAGTAARAMIITKHTGS